ncbi:hypothetical protein VNO77_20209 [Canavalia gladiata]|uniref:Uncharacterized protein n=1 Tax=Canavalia gladiata TaxID=3824 RepID=A0AAN9LNU3_CANGL
MLKSAREFLTHAKRRIDTRMAASNMVICLAMGPGAANKTIKQRFQVDAMRCSDDTENVELCRSRMNVTMGFYERDTSKKKTMVVKSMSLRGRGSSLHKVNEEHTCKSGPLTRNCTKVPVFVNSGPYTQKL